MGALVSSGFRAASGKHLPNWKALQLPLSIESERLKSLPAGQSADAYYSYLKASGKALKSALPKLGLLIVDQKLQPEIEEALPILWTDFPDAAMDFILQKSYPASYSGETRLVPPGVIAEKPYFIGPDTLIGEGTIIESNVRIGARVKIGTGCRIGAGSRINDDTIIGNDCVLLGMDAIGGPGFGTIRYPGSEVQRMRAHVGRVVIGDRVRLGSHVSIDRGVFDDTQIGDDCLFDNHVQVGHNCIIGKNSIFCSFVGLSGSTIVGDQTVFAGMVGTAGHVKIGSRVVVAAQSGISKDIEDGAQVKGYPPKPIAEALKIQTLVGKLPELFERIKKIEKSKESK